MVLCVCKSSAQNGIELGAKSMGLGNANSSISDNWSVFNNPSGISSENNTSAFFTAKNQYGITALTSIGAGIIRPINIGAIGISAYRFGDDLHHQQYLSLTYANEFGIGQLGLRLNYYEVFIEGFGNKALITVDFGGIVDLSEQLSIGAYIRNISRARLSEFEDERLPTILNVGISFWPDKKLMVNVDLEKDIEFDPRLKVGLEYLFFPKFRFRTGINTAPFNNFFGLGFTTWKVGIDYAIQVDYTLGTSHQLSLNYHLSKK